MKPTSFPAMSLLLLVSLSGAAIISSTTAVQLAPTPDSAYNLADPTTQPPVTTNTTNTTTTTTTEFGPTLKITPTTAVATANNQSNIASRGIPDDKLAGITCRTRRYPYEGQAQVKRINQGYEYLWRRGSYWTIGPNHADRISCSWDSAIFLINETPNQITIAFARVADLARNIRIKCDDTSNNVNGEVTDYGGSIIVVSQSNC